MIRLTMKWIAGLAALALLAGSAGAAARPASSRPNIVLLLVDDLGWSDLGYRNPAVFETPNIDALAREGTDFTQAYIPCPTCSPSRGTLLTGKHPVRLGLVRHIPVGPKFPQFDEFGRAKEEFHQWPGDPAHFPSRNWLPLEHVTYAEALRGLGYYNLFAGKWHLGHEPYHPVHQGFDRQIGVSNFGHPRSYYPPYFKNSETFAGEKERYLTDKLTDEVVGFIRSYDQPRPFMISLWYYNVHAPHIGRKEDVRHFEAKGLEGRYANYAAMLKAVDDSVGRIRAALRQKGVADNTIVIFLGDQGGYFENKPFRGGKRFETLYEGGARVPLIVHWPGVTKPGWTNASLVQSTDLFPTLVEMAGGDPSKFKALDGVSLVPILRSNATLSRKEPLFGYRAYEDLYASVRLGDWKLLAWRSGSVRLYNIARDIAEEHDLAASHPDKVAELKARLAAWERAMGVAKYSGIQ